MDSEPNSPNDALMDALRGIRGEFKLGASPILKVRDLSGKEENYDLSILTQCLGFVDVRAEIDRASAERRTESLNVINRARL